MPGQVRLDFQNQYQINLAADPKGGDAPAFLAIAAPAVHFSPQSSRNTRAGLCFTTLRVFQ